MKSLLLLLLAIVIISAYFLLQNEGADVSRVAPAKTTAEDVEMPVTQNDRTEPSLSNSTNSTAAQDNHFSSGHKNETPLDSETREAVSELVNTSHEGLVEEQTANGVAIDLKGRFRTAPVATVNEQGEVTVRDYTSAPIAPVTIEPAPAK